MTKYTSPTSSAADLLTLIEAYAEARHRQGHSSYNAQTATTLQAVKDTLAQCFDAADMATAAAQGFRDGVASLSANAGEPRNAIDRDALIDAIAQGLHGTWHCTRVWEAWHVGTMSQDDFEPVDESETPTEIADAVLVLLAAPPAAQAVVQDDLITLRKPTTSAELLWLLKLAQLVISDVDKTLEETFSPAQPAAAGAAPECLTCSDHGAVGNILTAEPCPDCTRLNTQQAGEAADSVPAVSDLPPLPAPDLRDVGTKPQEIKEFLKGYATEYARTAIAASAPEDSVQEDAARYRFLRDGEWRDTDLEPFIRLQLNTLWDAKIDAARGPADGESK